MEHPVSGYSSRKDISKKPALVHGGTSLKLSEGGESPVLEAHPGSPVDITGRRPSLTTSMAAQRLYHGSDEEFARFTRTSKFMGKKEEAIKRDGVAAKAYFSGRNRDKKENEMMKSPNKRMQVAGVQPFYIPAKVPEQEEFEHVVHEVPAAGDDKQVDTSVESTDMDFEFEEDNGIWISANPIARESRTSLATTTTVTSAASTLMDHDRYSAVLTLDTSVASSAASMMSSAASIQSATTATSSDIYGWEEELDRKASIEGHNVWERELAQKLPSGGRTMGTRLRGMPEFPYKRADSKKRSLLYRVLNLSGRERRGSTDDFKVAEIVNPSDEYPNNST
jgi:hypothetical protein